MWLNPFRKCLFVFSLVWFVFSPDLLTCACAGWNFAVPTLRRLNVRTCYIYIFMTTASCQARLSCKSSSSCRAVCFLCVFLFEDERCCSPSVFKMKNTKCCQCTVANHDIVLLGIKGADKKNTRQKKRERRRRKPRKTPLDLRCSYTTVCSLRWNGSISPWFGSDHTFVVHRWWNSHKSVRFVLPSHSRFTS